MTVYTNKAQHILALIKEGGATTESLMEATSTNKAGLASQLSYLNARGLNIAEVDKSLAEFPIKGEDGIFRMLGYDAYMAKRAAGTGGFQKKSYSLEELTERAQKREDKASAVAAKAEEKLNADPDNNILALRVVVADAQLKLASALLSALEQGDTSNE